MARLSNPIEIPSQTPPPPCLLWQYSCELSAHKGYKVSQGAILKINDQAIFKYKIHVKKYIFVTALGVIEG